MSGVTVCVCGVCGASVPVRVRVVCTQSRDDGVCEYVSTTITGKYLGGRWSLAYYSIIGVLDPVARDEAHYVNLAVSIASDPAYKKDIQNRIANNLHKLWRQNRAVENWADLLEKIARKNQESEL